LDQDRPLRILQLCSSSATSGAEKHVVSLSTQLRRKGHEVLAVTPGPGWLPEALRDQGIPTESRLLRGKGYYPTIGHLIRRARRERIDVIHTHLTRAAYIGYAVGLLTKTPIITSVHIANNDQIYKRLARRRNRLVAVSGFVRGMLHGRGIPERFIDTVYNGTDFLDFEPSDPNSVKDELGIPRERRIVGLVARITPEKGQLEMIRAMRQVRREHPDAHMVFVGRVEEGFGDELERVIEEERMRDRLTLTGVRHDIPRVMDSFTLSSLPSRMETFGVAAIEAMARGKAVVATKVGALPEVVRHKQTGLLVDLRPDEIAEAVSYLLANGEEREEMGRAGRDLVERKFSLGEMATRFEAVYRKTLA
jgi:glycosyltransferase involved in cell wall biosynthesis